MATFVGFAPASNPTLSMIVVLDRPTPIFGGTVSAPVFSQIMSDALHRYDIPTSPGADGERRQRWLNPAARGQSGPGHHVTGGHTGIADVTQARLGHATLSLRSCDPWR